MLEINESLQTLKPSISTTPSPTGLGGENGGGSCGGNGGILLDQALNKSLSSWFSVGGGGPGPLLEKSGGGGGGGGGGGPGSGPLY